MGELGTVRSVRDKAAIVDTYRNAFKARFGLNPIIDINVANDVCGWLVEQVGFQKAKDLVETYLEINDQWIEDQGFPLEVLRRQINKVMVALGKRDSKKAPAKMQVLRLNLWTACKNHTCKEIVWVECNSDEVETVPYSQFCGKCSIDPNVIVSRGTN